MVYHRSWRLPTICRWKHSEARFNTLGSPVGGGGFNRSRAFRRAWECWAKGSWGCGTKGSWEASGRSLGMSWGCFLTSWGSLGEGPGGPDEVPGRPRRALGGLLELLRPAGRLRGGFQRRMRRSWGPKRSQKGVQNGPKRGPKAIRAENCKIIKVDHSTQDLLGF